MRGGTGDAVGRSDSTVFVDARGQRRSPANALRASACPDRGDRAGGAGGEGAAR